MTLLFCAVITNDVSKLHLNLSLSAAAATIQLSVEFADH